MGTDPANLSPSANLPPLGVLAGGGSLPRKIIEAAIEQGRPVFVVAFHGQTDCATVADLDHVWVRMGEAGRTIAELKRKKITDLVLAGPVRRPSLSELGLDWRGAQLFARIGARALGDDGLLRAVSRELESEGFRLVGADQILDGLTQPVGLLGSHAPDEQALADIQRGLEVARALGGVDVGQAVVVQQGLVLAVEAIEGTDALLDRAGAVRRAGPGGVLVKIAKPQQDRRVDLPTIGPQTVTRAAVAGLRGIAFGAQTSIVLDRAACVAAADAAGLFLFAVDLDQARPGVNEIGPLLYLVAGEPSGDILGGRLMAALRRRANGSVRFAGIGGPRMIAEGLAPLFPMTELSVMGLAEIVPKIPHLLRRIRETAADVQRLRPAALVTIDAPDFSFRVARRIYGSGIPCIHYVAPTVWAWRPGRAAKIARHLDHLLTLLPFEPPYFERAGLAASFVGHSAIEDGPQGDGFRFRQRHGITPDRTIILMLPGSRAGEVGRLLPIFIKALERLGDGRAAPRIVVPVPEYLEATVKAGLAPTALDWITVTGEAEKRDAFAAANVALAKSGTVTLELALAGVPTVIAYRISPITYAIVRRQITAEYAGLPNLILDRPLMPEFLQDACTPEALSAALAALLDDEAARRAQLDGVAEVRRRLTPPGGSPSAMAAEIVLRVALGSARRLSAP